MMNDYKYTNFKKEVAAKLILYNISHTDVPVYVYLGMTKEEYIKYTALEKLKEKLHV